MGLLDGGINSQIGGLGAMLFGVQRTLPFDKKHNDAFVPFLKRYPLVIVLQGPAPGKANYISGGIQGATKSFWTHALLMGCKEAQYAVRDKFSYLCTRLNYPIPCNPFELEFAEATYPRCQVAAYGDHYLNDNVQSLAFGFPDVKVSQVVDILRYAYSKHGRNYDTKEILADAFPDLSLSHPKTFHGCSSLVATACTYGNMAVVGPDVAPYMAWPSHIREWLYPQKEIKIAKWNIV